MFRRSPVSHQVLQALLQCEVRALPAPVSCRWDSTFSVDRSGLFQPQSFASGKHAHKEPETDMAKQIKALIQVLATTDRPAR